MARIKGFKKIKHTGKKVIARYYNENKNIQVTIQRQRYGKGVEVRVYNLSRGIGAKINKKFSTVAKAKAYATRKMRSYS